MSRILEFTILGCGSSGGVPRADGDWGNDIAVTVEYGVVYKRPTLQGKTE